MDNSVNFPLTRSESGLVLRAIVRGVQSRVIRMVNCLLIDKNANDRQSMLRLLSDLGLSCEERAGAAEGIKFCNERQPEVVLMEASGLSSTKDFLRLVKYQNRAASPPIVILYAEKPDMDAIGQSIMEGAADFIMTPITRDLLQFKLAQAGVVTH